MRVDLVGTLVATAAAVTLYVLALRVHATPPSGMSVLLLVAAPLLAASVLPVLVVRARAEDDAALMWFAAGLGVSLVAMVLQLISIPIVVPGGGPFGTRATPSAQLYLLFHLALALGVLAAMLRLPGRSRPWFVALGSLLALACATNHVPSPPLLQEDDAVFTPLLGAVGLVLAGVVALAAVTWTRRIVPSARHLRAWAGVALSISAYDLVLFAVSSRRYDAVWWSSLSLRAATYAVLAVGAVVTLLVEIHRLEGYTHRELHRSDAKLKEALEVTGRLLDSAESLTRAVTVKEVGEAVTRSVLAVTGLPRVAVILLDEELDRLRAVASCGYDDVSRDFMRDYPRDAALPAGQVLESGRPIFSSSVAALRRDYRDLRNLPVHDDIGNLAVLPLPAADGPVGVLAVSGPAPRDWSPMEREVLGAIAAQAGQAVQRATLYERHRSAAELLQRGLLPQRLPQVAGLSMAARYVPGEAGLRIGGDWYDCVPVCEGRLALVIGDVMGKGVQAATRMAQVRNAVRVLASIDPSPSAVVAGLDRLAEDLEEDQLVTLVYVLLDPATGSARMSRVGHLPPLLVSPHHAPELLNGGGSPPLGVPDAVRCEHTLHIPHGSVLLLFTDGLVEDRRTGLDVGLPALMTAGQVLVERHQDVEQLADAVLAASEHDTARPDDTCLLVVRRGGETVAAAPGGRLDREIVLPTDHASTAVARRFVLDAVDVADIGDSGPARLGDRLDDLVILCSELVTNAVLHAGGPCRVRLWDHDGRVRLEVHDPSPRLPVRRTPDPTAPNGRGMALVEALADDWGVDDSEPGKSVWVEVSLERGP
jgi:serine phosphatase RsbU (regulator of sigma subunit)